MHFSQFKGDLQIFRFDLHRLSSNDSPGSYSMYVFSLVVIKKTLTQAFFDDVIRIVTISTKIIEGE